MGRNSGKRISLKFELRFDICEVGEWAGKYKDPNEYLVESLAPQIRGVEFLSKEQFLTLAKWKSPRSRNLCGQNPPEYVEAITRFALGSTNERFRVEALTLLRGIGWPTASVILHFAARDRYPILDFRALWSLSIFPPAAYNFEFWWAYVLCCRVLADNARVDMRTLDKALWAYSKANQPA